MNLTHIPKFDSSKGSTKDQAPCWIETVSPKLPHAFMRPNIICKCGVPTDIGNHHVHSDGRVTASYYHTQNGGCGWHVFLKLKNYHGTRFLPEKK